MSNIEKAMKLIREISSPEGPDEMDLNEAISFYGELTEILVKELCSMCETIATIGEEDTQ